jgi:hypothetical protein
MFLIFVLVALLVIAAATSFSMWTSIGSDPTVNSKGMSRSGVIALVLGGVGTLALGGGLMALVFFSARRGYDDAADMKARRPEDR